MKPPLSSQNAALALGSLFENQQATALAALERTDSEALHDLRVALRHLVVLVEQLASASKPRARLLRDIKKVLKQSNRARDLQVMSDWLQAQWPGLSAAELVGARRWQRKLMRLQQRVEPESARLAVVLRRMAPLSQALPTPPDTPRQALGLLVAQRLEKRAAELVALLKPGQAAQLHRIRLKTKMVRYLLSPFASALPACSHAESLLKEMQTALGEWHDGVLREQSLHHYLCKAFVALEAVSGSRGIELQWAQRTPSLPGLLALARRNRRAQARLTARIEQHYLHDGGAQLTGLMAQALAELRRAATACPD